MHSNPHANQTGKPQHPTQHADSRGYYLALHVSPDASQEEISRAFRALIRVRHPDVGHSDVGHSVGQGAAAEDDVRSILAAFAVLRNPRTRAEYDRAEHAAARLHAAQRSRHKAPMHDFAGSDVPERTVPPRDVLVRLVPPREVPVRTAPVREVPVHTVPPREVPVRIIRQRGPLLHVSPVRWERGPG